MSLSTYAEITAPQTVRPKDLLQIIIASLEADQPLMIWSAPGLGKSSITNLASILTGHVYHDLRLPLMERVDLLGVPYVSSDHRTMWATPGFLPPEDSPLKHLINLEELPNASRDMLTAVYQITLDRRCGDYMLPKSARIIACGNRVKDRGGVQRLPPPLASRFFHVELKADVDDWLDWAVDNDVDADVRFFIRFHPDYLHDFDPTRDEPAFPCPRTWAALSNIKPKIENLDDTIQRAVYRGTVGETAATAFGAFLAMKHEIPQPKTVLLDPSGAKVPDNASAKIAIASSISRMADEFNMDAICTYATRLGPEIADYLVGQCIRRDPATEQTDGYARWAARTT